MKAISRRGFFGGGAAVVAIICLVVIGLVAVVRVPIKLTEAQIQERVDAKLPAEKAGVSIEKITFDLADADVGILASGSITKLDQTYAFAISARGVPSYRFMKGEFYFTPSDVKIIALERTSEGASLGDKLKGLADKYLSDDNEIGVKVNTIAKDLADKVEGWMQTAVEEGAKFALERVPVYTLPDEDMGFVAQAVLDNVTVKDSTLVATLSLWRLTSWVLLFGFLGLASIAFVVVLISSPGLFAGALIIGAFSS